MSRKTNLLLMHGWIKSMYKSIEMTTEVHDLQMAMVEKLHEMQQHV